ncbi:MAG: hypothetical protein AAGN15_24890 [Cyanobacteria bacterium J06581_3]
MLLSDLLGTSRFPFNDYRFNFIGYIAQFLAITPEFALRLVQCVQRIFVL